jgi:transcriptional regulator of acetoin/glycerol metabolism
MSLATHSQGALPHWGSPMPAQRIGHDLIRSAHLRSESFGLREHDEPDFSSLPKADLDIALDENSFLFQHAAPVMATLYDQIANTHSMVLLTSSKGLVLHSLGDTDFLEKASRVALTPGMDWSEQSKGTNAIGTALSEAEALTVHGGQHYMNANKFLTCSCAPIYDPHGQVIGALDVTGDHHGFQKHTLALVRMSVQMIENHMFADIFQDAVRLHFHARSEFLGTLVEGIAVFSPNGRFISANRSAQFQLGLSFSALKAHTFSSLFGIPMSSLLAMFGGSAPSPKQLVLHNGVMVWCKTTLKRAAPWSAEPHDRTRPATDGPAREALPCHTTQLNRPSRPTLSELNTGDPQMAAVVHKLKLVSGRDIPIMIQGETGSGKDLLAQAIHNDSPRAGKAFISINCASIPETLIESELFGYEEGAFTGARKKGAVGKILLAHGGTLFLDEIGDMPRHLQARLLRVLQERKVTPLGSDKEVEVDIAVVCATHKNLKGMIAQGEFREDLYYRLNGLVVRLPALRERSDFEAMVGKIVQSLCDHGQAVSISTTVLDLFKRYHWPGNFRQLHNLLRTAVVMVGPQGSIELTHLPDDFLEELQIIPTLPLMSSMAAAAGTPLLAAPMGHSHPGTESLENVTLSAMAQMLRLHKGNVSAAAKALGVSRNTIYRKKDQLPPDALSS